MTMLLSSCQSSWGKPIPHNEIVYQASYYYSKIGLPQYQLGFIQADGENNQIVEIDRKFEKPVWSINGLFLYGLSDGKADYIGYPAYWNLEKGSFKVCNQNLGYFEQIQGLGNVEKPHEVVVQDVWKIIVVDLSNCTKVLTLVDYSDNPGDFWISGFSYSHSTKELVYGLVVNPYKDPYRERKYKIMLQDIKNGEQVQLAEGINPAWSPDGSKIAYLGLDGLYVMLPNGTESKQLLRQPFYDAWRSGSPPNFISFLSWSPDGEWLVYHRCSTEEVCMIEDSNIYKIRMSDASEELILTGGEYPSWRP